jgi:hypothetical protein
VTVEKEEKKKKLYVLTAIQEEMLDLLSLFLGITRVTG